MSVKQMLMDSPEGIRSPAKTPAGEELFEVNDSPALDKIQAEIFHTFMAKNLYIFKIGRPDIQVAVAFLCTRVKAPSEIL